MEFKTGLYSCDEVIRLEAQVEALDGWQEYVTKDGGTRIMKLWLWEVTWVRYTEDEQYLIDNPIKPTRAEILEKARDSKAAKKVKGLSEG